MFQTSGYDLSHIPFSSNVTDETQNILPLTMACQLACCLHDMFLMAAEDNHSVSAF
jgi:hypothetical protein